MKKNFFQMSKYFMLASAFCMGMAFTACDDDDDDEPKKDNQEQKEDKEDEKKEDEKKEDEKKEDGAVEMEGKVISERDYTALPEGYETFWMADAAKEMVTIDGNGFTMVNGAEMENPWDNQYLILDHFSGCASGADYHIYVTMVSDGAGTMGVSAGSWGNNDALSFDFEAGEKTYNVTFAGTNIGEDADHVNFNSGKFVGTYTIKKVVFTMVE